MKISTLKERIEMGNQKITRKQNTIVKKTALFEKKKVLLAKAQDENERYWITCDINHLEEDIMRLGREIKETENTLDKYQKQLAGEIERESLLVHEVPETLKTLQTELVTEWDEYDKNRRDRIIKDYHEMPYHCFCVKYRGKDTQIRYKTVDEIHNENVRDAEAIILNLVNRVKDITGEITNWGHLYLEPDNHGFSILNGRVEGKEGIAYVESIGAGGYNIQRYHIRVLVKAR